MMCEYFSQEAMELEALHMTHVNGSQSTSQCHQPSNCSVYVYCRQALFLLVLISQRDDSILISCLQFVDVAISASRLQPCLPVSQRRKCFPGDFASASVDHSGHVPLYAVTGKKSDTVTLVWVNKRSGPNNQETPSITGQNGCW